MAEGTEEHAEEYAEEEDPSAEGHLGVLLRSDVLHCVHYNRAPAVVLSEEGMGLIGEGRVRRAGCLVKTFGWGAQKHCWVVRGALVRDGMGAR